MVETKVTQKYQTTIPEKIRKHLGIKPGDEVDWEVVKAMVVVDTNKKIKNPTKFLTSQIKKGLNFDAVKLIREAREEFT